MVKKLLNFFKKYPAYNAIVHATGGLGLGILIARPFIGPHPLRFGIGLLVLAILGHLYPLTLKGK